jgi:putative solute:sodium symporter small subunit
LLGVWLLATFGVGYFAYDLQILIGGWPLGYWVAAQGAVLVFLALVVLYCCMMARFERRPQQGQPPSTDSHD